MNSEAAQTARLAARLTTESEGIGAHPMKDADTPDLRVTRKLTTILHADVSGYSRLMGEDETGTLNALNLHRAELIHPTVAEHIGSQYGC